MRVLKHTIYFIYFYVRERLKAYYIICFLKIVFFTSICVWTNEGWRNTLTGKVTVPLRNPSSTFGVGIGHRRQTFKQNFRVNVARSFWAASYVRMRA
jgi:hypothetical protein